jgi:hypothetical protein
VVRVCTGSTRCPNASPGAGLGSAGQKALALRSIEWSARLSAIATADQGQDFTIDGKAVVLGPDGLSRFEELSCHEAARTAILYAFDLIEHYGDDMRNRPFLDRKAALGRLLREAMVGMRFEIRRGGNVNVPRMRVVRTIDPSQYSIRSTLTLTYHILYGPTPAGYASASARPFLVAACNRE